MEQVSSLRWNDCPVCAGMTVQFAAEQVSSLRGIRTLLSALPKIRTNPKRPLIWFLASVHHPLLYEILGSTLSRRHLQDARWLRVSVKIDAPGFGPHTLRVTAATNALEHDADIAKLREWLGHANIATTRICDGRKMRAEDSPTFKVNY